MPDAHETARQHMQQEASQELLNRKSPYPLLVSVCGVPPAECDLIVLKTNETAVGNRNSMRVSAEVAKHLFGAAERRFAICNPAQAGKLTDETPKESGLRPALEHAVEAQMSGSVCLPESFEELAPEDFAEDIFGQEEARVSGMYPVRVIAGEAASGHDAMNMWMMLQLLIPGMKDAEETDLRSEVRGIRCDFDQSLGAGAQEQAVDHFFVLQCQGGQLMRKREDDMGVGRRQQFGASCFEPAVARLALTLRAVPVTA